MNAQVQSKFLVRALIVAAVLTGGLCAEGVQLGDSMEQVIDELGSPRGQMSVGDTLIFSYEQGTVSIADGKVTETNLKSARQLKEKKVQTERRRAERAAEEAAALKARIDEGTAEKLETSNDPNFTNLSYQVQLDHWIGFEKIYPEVSVTDKILPLKDIVQKEAREEQVAEKAALDQQIEELEESIDALANRRGIGRSALRQGNRDLARMRAELEEMRRKKIILDRNRPQTRPTTR